MARPRRMRQRGIALLWTVISLVALIAMVGLAIDTVHVVFASQQLQAGADSAALAGAQQVRHDLIHTREKALELAFANHVNGTPITLDPNWDNVPEGDVVIGRFNRDDQQFTPTMQGPNAVFVTARRNADVEGGRLPLLFGRIFGFDAVDLQSSAIAMVGGGTGAGLIALNEDARCSLRVRGSVDVHVEDGAVQVNSSNHQAACNNGNAATLHAPELNIYGDVSSGFEDILTEDAELNTNTEEAVPDPLAEIPEPDYDPASPASPPGVNISGSDTSVTLEPGYYPDGIAMSSGNLTLEPGIYNLGGEGLNVTGGNLYADGVMFHVVDDGSVNLRGNGELVIRPPDPDTHAFPEAATYEGISIFQSRTNHNEATIVGTNNMDLEGTLYFPENHLKAGGTSESLGNQLIADTIELHGTGDLTIKYDGRFPAAGFRVFLVN